LAVDLAVADACRRARFGNSSAFRSTARNTVETRRHP
jgi:hypothetical protein